MSEKIITYDELRAHTTKDSIYLLISGKVYDVTKFLDEHPGGDEVILAEAGHDATEGFEDVGHSDEARALLPGLFVGEFDKNSGLDIKSGAAAAQASRVSGAVEQGSNMMYFIPLAMLGGYFAWRFYTTGSV
ncbi:cytochrome b5-like heme/steroid binding domain-containing protein [Desarmillaria ectypa]|nr:cytochrome b5-like heme/steroid binding domain-containing protein [Desarmillaria ectypa]